MNIVEEKKENKRVESMSLSRHLWVGGAIGLYFGWFFRPAREPSWVIVIFLGLLITVVLAAWQIFRRKKENRTVGQILRRLPMTFVQYAIVLTFLEARHFAYDFGGRFAVIIMTTILGALSGLWMAYQSGNLKRPAPNR